MDDSKMISSFVKAISGIFGNRPSQKKVRKITRKTKRSSVKAKPKPAAKPLYKPVTKTKGHSKGSAKKTFTNVQMPAPWSKVEKFKRIKKENYY